MSSDRGVGRLEERVTINTEFESFDAFIDEYVTNISRTGAFIKCNDPPPVGSRVSLRFSVLTEDLEAIEGEAEVVRVQNDPPGMGVVFVSLSDESRALIEKLLARRRSS